MDENDVLAVLTEAATQLTERGNKTFDDATVLEQRGGQADALVTRARVDLEAARRIRGLAVTSGIGRGRGPRKPAAVSGNGKAAPAAPVGVTRTWPGN